MIPGLNNTMAVFTPDSDGAYTVEAQTDVVCRLNHISRNPANLGGEREAIGDDRLLMWSQVYVMPDDAQIEIDGQRWNVREGSCDEITGADFSTIVYRRCQVMKVL